MGGLPFMDHAIATPTEAGAMGAVGALVLAAIHRRLTWPLLKDAMEGTMRLTAMVVFILIGSRVFSLVFQGVDGAKWIEHMLSGLPGGQIGFLIAVNVFVFFLAFFLDFFEIAFIILPMLGPVAHKLGIDMVWFGVLLCVNMQTSFMHPPFGFALFYLRGIADTLFKNGALPRKVRVARHLPGRHPLGGDAAAAGGHRDLLPADRHRLPRQGGGGRHRQGAARNADRGPAARQRQHRHGRPVRQHAAEPAVQAAPAAPSRRRRGDDASASMPAATP